MTTLTVHGPFADVDGVALQHDAAGAHLSAWPAGNYRTCQGDRIGVHLSHRGPELGEVVHLELRHRHLHAVAVIDLDRGDERDADMAGPLYWSAAASGSGGGLTATDIELREISLTDTPAGLGLQPVTLIAGDIRSDFDRAHWPIGTMTPLLANAVEAARNRRLYRGPLTIRRADPVPLAGGRLWVDGDGELVPATRAGPVVYDDQRRPVGRLEYGQPGRIISVT